jgi:flagellar biosynthesis GTPase FlhF
LQDWIVQERYRMITLFGMAGIGKTALAAKLAQQEYSRIKKIQKLVRPTRNRHKPLGKFR